MEPPETNRELDDACERVARVTLIPTFGGGTYVFEPPNVASGTWLRLGSEPLPGETAVLVPAMFGEHFALRKARCRVLLEDALTAAGQRAPRSR